jgi:Putative transposase/Transposase zinc-binding domain
MAQAPSTPRLREEVQGEGGYFAPVSPNLEVCETAAVYRPRNPAESILYGVVAGHVETFLEAQRRRDRRVPRLVERELRSFFDCGVLGSGFLRLHCDACRQDRLVPYSCKGRGFCPSCGGRRMADTAAHLVDRVFPEVPVRQWVLSLPFPLRYRLAYDSSLVQDVLQIFVRAVFASIRRQAGVPASNRKARCGAVTFVQRFGDALNLNVHFHSLALDGIYVEDEEGNLALRHVARPSDAEVARVTERIRRRVARILKRRGLGPQSVEEDPDSFRHDQPLLAELYGASVSGLVATRPRPGRRIVRVGDTIEWKDQAVSAGPRCASIAGFSVHANVRIPDHDRLRLERILRYAGRPPLATERLSLLPDGRLLYRLKRRWRDGTSHVIFEPLELTEKLAALVPPPRFNLVRYHGVLDPSAGFRSLIIPESESSASPAHPHCPAGEQGPAPRAEKSAKRSGCRPRNYSWAEPMRRVLSVDVLECPRCGGRPRILCVVHPPEAIRKILECLGIPSRPPPVCRATGVDDPCSW